MVEHTSDTSVNVTSDADSVELQALPSPDKSTASVSSSSSDLSSRIDHFVADFEADLQVEFRALDDLLNDTKNCNHDHHRHIREPPMDARIQALTAELQVSRDELHRLDQRTEQERKDWTQRMQQLEQQWATEKLATSEQTVQQLQDATAQHESELRRVNDSHETVLVEATRAAAAVTERARREMLASRAQVAAVQGEYAAKLQVTAHQAARQATDATMASARALLQQHTAREAQDRKEAIQAFQTTCNALEQELGNTLFQYQDLQAEHNITCAMLEAEIDELQQDVEEAVQATRTANVRAGKEYQVQLAALGKEKDEAVYHASQFENLVTLMEHEIEQERETYRLEAEQERSKAAVLETELEQLRASRSMQLAESELSLRIHLLSIVEACRVQYQLQKDQEIYRVTLDKDQAVWETTKEQHAAEKVELFQSTCRNLQREQEGVLQQRQLQHKNELQLVHETKLADMVDMFHLCHTGARAIAAEHDVSTTEDRVSVHIPVLASASPAVVIEEPEPAAVPIVESAADAVDNEASEPEAPTKFTQESSGKAERPVPTNASTKEVIEKCVGHPVTDSNKTTSAGVHAATTPKLSVPPVSVPGSPEGSLQSPTSAFAAYSRTESTTESSKAEPSMSREISKTPVLRSALKRPVKRDTALRRPTSISFASSSGRKNPVPFRSTLSRQEDDSGLEKSNGSAAKDRVKRKPSLASFSSSSATSNSKPSSHNRVSASGGAKERSTLPVPSRSSQTKKGETSRVPSDSVPKKRSYSQVDSEDSRKKVRSLAPPKSTFRSSRLPTETQASRRRKPAVAAQAVPSRTSATGNRASSSTSKRMGGTNSSVVATSRLAKPTVKARSLLPKYGIQRAAGSIKPGPGTNVGSKAKSSGLKTPSSSSRRTRAITPSTSTSVSSVVGVRSSVKSAKRAVELSGLTGTSNASRSIPRVAPGSSVRFRVGTSPSVAPLSSKGGGKVSPKEAIENVLRTFSPIPESKSASDGKDKLSPKEAVENVLRALSPCPKPKTTPRAFPREHIEQLPLEISSQHVDKKFQSLFTDWSTTKKSPRMGGTSTRAMDGLPSSLFAEWSTKKKEAATPSKSTKRAQGTARTNILHRAEALLASSLKSRSPPPISLVSPLPSKSTSFVNAEFSPEELLISPTPFATKLTKAPSSARDDYLTQAVTRIQAVFRARSVRISQGRFRSAVVTLQTLHRVSLARHQMETMATSLHAVRAKSAMIAQSVIRGALQRTKYACIMAAALTVQRSVRAFIASKQASKLASERNTAVSLQYNWQDAAVTIQRHCRGLLCQTRYTSILSSTLTIQRTARGFIAQSHVSKLEIARDAAVTIQQIARGFIARRQAFKLSTARDAAVQAATCAVLTMQRHSRGLIQRTRYNYILAASKTIQRIARGFIAQGRVSKLEIARDAAVTIQQIARGFIARGQASKLSTVRDAVVQAATRAALTIQRHIRGVVQRTRFNSILAASLTIQRIARGFIAQGRVSELEMARDAAVTIQQIARVFIARGHASKLSTARDAGVQHAVIAIQKHCRGLLSRTRYVSTLESVLALQRTGRGFIARSQASELSTARDAAVQHAVLTIQKHCRGLLCRNRYMSTLEAVVALQRTGRGLIAKSHASKLATARDSAVQDAVLTIQRHCRGTLCRTQYVLTLESIVTLQLTARGFIARSHVSKLATARDSAVHLQATVRGFNARREASRRVLKLRASESIQKYWRGALAHSQFSTVRRSIILIQAVARRAHARVLVDSMLVKNWEKPITSIATSLKEGDKATVEVRGSPAPLMTADNVFTVLNEPKSKPKRKPFGEVKASAPIFSPLKTRRGTVVKIKAPANEENKANTIQTTDVELRQSVEQLKVIELKEELTGYGMEMKTLRKIRKAELVEMVLTQRPLNV